MGESKRKREALRAMLLAKTEPWVRPAEPWEAEMAAEVAALPVVRAVRLPREEVAWMQMPANECHQNAQWYADHDESGTWKAVTGWITFADGIGDGNYVLHSVVFDGKIYACLTPLSYDDIGEVEFKPDPRLVWRDADDGTRYCTRGGHRLEVGLRSNPERSIAQTERMRAHVLAGGDPLDIMLVGRAGRFGLLGGRDPANVPTSVTRADYPTDWTRSGAPANRLVRQI